MMTMLPPREASLGRRCPEQRSCCHRRWRCCSVQIFIRTCPRRRRALICPSMAVRRKRVACPVDLSGPFVLGLGA